MKNKPHYALQSVDHALQLAVILQVEGPQTVTEVARRLDVARSTAHRLLSMLVYRDFARQGGDRRYYPGPVISLEAGGSDHTGVLRGVAMPHLQVLVDRTGESANVMVLAGDYVRFIASVESPHTFRVGNREGMVFPAHLTSGGKPMLADLSPEERADLYDPARWEGREDERPDVDALERELEVVRRRGFAINRDRTETGVTAIGRGLRVAEQTSAAVTVSMPTVRFQEERLVDVVSALALATRDIEHDLEARLHAERWWG
ncbi:IclR family transcriptional regulator [Intrasporangium calvum]|uniref:Transcriptional regulator, IclR family n=1 Tax=Intrasporangium calvum (strain ATCC 23552 / DSM 43043 / JCM 3097 / NBRC 12989 / NCIMB 10167 / NRRL B-3866 / 7 KIP) TaxID=710696 RepID=E6SFA0_INTC7|nr:IclR family transcriptional regulator [Intrasporangium calvum]ADU49914.1 transcriptional regulator, IclR family [Intrasporangium calvum DSM 43043]